MSQVRSFFQISSSLNHGQRIKVFDSSDEEIEVISSDDSDYDNTSDGSDYVGARRRPKVPKALKSLGKKSKSGKTPKVKTPKVKTPKVKTPKVKTPKVKTPKVTTPKVKTPKVKTPKAPVTAGQSAAVKKPKKPKVSASGSTTSITTETRGRSRSPKGDKTKKKKTSRSRDKVSETADSSTQTETSRSRSRGSRKNRSSSKEAGSEKKQKKSKNTSVTPSATTTTSGQQPANATQTSENTQKKKKKSRSRSRSRNKVSESNNTAPQRSRSRNPRPSSSSSQEQSDSGQRKRRSSRSKSRESDERMKYKQKKETLKKKYEKELGKATAENKTQLEGRYKEKLESMRQKFKEKRNQAFASGRQDQGQYQQQAQPVAYGSVQPQQYPYGTVPPQAAYPMGVPVAPSSVPMVQYVSTSTPPPLNPMMAAEPRVVPNQYSYPPARFNWDGASDDEKREILSQLNWSPWVTFPLAMNSLSSSDIERLRQEKEVLARSYAASRNPENDDVLKNKTRQYKKFIREIANQRTKNQYDLVSVMKQDPKYANLSDSDIITRARTMSDREQKRFFKKFVKSNSNIGAELIGCHTSSFNADEGETVHLFINDPPFERVHAMVKAGGMFQIMPEHSNIDLYQLQGKINAILLFEFFSLIRQLESYFMDSPADTDTAARSIVVSSAERSVSIVPISSLDLNKKLSSKMTRLWQLFDRILFSIRKENYAQSIGGKRKTTASANEIDIVWNTFIEWIPGQKIKERHLLKSAPLQLLLDLIYACADITYATRKANKQLLKESEKTFQSLMNQSKKTFSATQTIIQDMLQILHHFIVVLPSQFTVETIRTMKNQMIQARQLTKFKLETSISI